RPRGRRPSFFTPRRPPPISTLFPYTTLFRSKKCQPELQRHPQERVEGCLDEQRLGEHLDEVVESDKVAAAHDVVFLKCDDRAARSEEHTSELQSRRDLVCRLLLEKKKNHEDH